MSVTFLGQYLVDRGIISTEQLLAALNDPDALAMARLAVNRGVLSVEDARTLANTADTKGKSFTDVALAKKKLTQEEIDYLAFLQKSDTGTLCRVLVDKGFADAETLQFAREELAAQQQPYAIEPQALPQHLSGRADIVAMLSMTQAELKKYGIAPAEISEPVMFTGRTQLRELSIRVRLSGDYSGLYVFTLDRGLGTIIAAQMFGVDALQSEEILGDALREFCNLVAGAAAGGVAAHGHHIGFAAPELVDKNAALGLMLEGARWGLKTPWGEGDILMD